MIKAACTAMILTAAYGSICGAADAEGGTYIDEINFVQYLDENTALEQIRNGNLDMYYFKIQSERIGDTDSRRGIDIYDSAGGSYSLLVNPSDAEPFNPFSIKEARFALNYLVDRELIVNELMGGYGIPKASYYGPYDAEYLTIVETLESFNFKYNPVLARELLDGAMSGAGAQLIDGIWHMDGEPISVNIFIRNDDPTRNAIGEILAANLAGAGFEVGRVYGDLNKAFVVVYGADPAAYGWHVYTEGWGSNAFTNYDSVGLAQMYAPWFANMPGFRDPSYWNYEQAELDEITKSIFSGNFSSAKERTELVRRASSLGVEESVRIFLAGNLDQYVVNPGVSGVINSFGGGIQDRLTPINAQTDSGDLEIGVKQIYQGSWNPVAGFTDKYSQDIWQLVHDPILSRHPYNGGVFGVRAEWSVDTAGPDGSLAVPPDAILWSPEAQEWREVGQGTTATSVIKYRLLFSDWHHGEPMKMDDILYSMYFLLEWGSNQTEGDITFDNEYSSRAQQTVNTLSGIRITGEDTIEVYVDYWHFDDSEIAQWGAAWSTLPWEIYAAMERAVTDGQVSFSRPNAINKGINWLSLLVPNDARIIQQHLEGFRDSGYVPAGLQSADHGRAMQRYDASISWIQENDHAVISNGPFYMDSYTPESRTIRIVASEDPGYPHPPGRWSGFEDVSRSRILSVDIPQFVIRAQDSAIRVETADATDLHYYVTGAAGSLAASGILDASGGTVDIPLDANITKTLGPGSAGVKLFATSQDVLRPDIYNSGFVATDREVGDLPAANLSDAAPPDTSPGYLGLLGLVIIPAAYIAYRRISAGRGTTLS